MKCPNCGEELKEGYLYCEKCGEEIRIVPEQANQCFLTRTQASTETIGY